MIWNQVSQVDVPKKGVCVVGALCLVLATVGSVQAEVLLPVDSTSTQKAQDTEEQRIDSTDHHEQNARGVDAFNTVYSVLQHPRCLNCHPSGDAPLQYEDSRPHSMNVTRSSTEAGLQCATCHQEKNSEAYGVQGGPPGAPNWHLPDADMPLIFEGRTASELCQQLKNPEQNGHKTLEQLYAHIAYDPLVLWGWEPGGTRSVPPVAHAKFVEQFRLWVDVQAPCPTESSVLESKP